MLKVEMTPKLLGFKVSGDHGDLDELYDAVWALTIADTDFPDDPRMTGDMNEVVMSERLLALNYDIRHAYQGSRNVELVDNGMSEWTAESHGVPLLEKNVMYSVEILYPEAMYEAIVLNYLIQKRRSLLDGKETYWHSVEDSSKTLLDKPICVVRMYLSKLLEAVEKRATPGRFARIRKEVAENYHCVASLYQQWVDILNNDYVAMTPKQRAEGLSTIVRDMTQFRRHEQYLDLVADIDSYVESHGTHRNNVTIPGLYGWSDPEW